MTLFQNSYRFVDSIRSDERKKLASELAEETDLEQTVIPYEKCPQNWDICELNFGFLKALSSLIAPYSLSHSHYCNGRDSFAEKGTGLVWLLLHLSTSPNNAATY